METKPLTIYGYELITQKFKGDSYDGDRFDFELLKYFFEAIIDNVPFKERAYRDKKRMINLVYFKQSLDPNVWEGEFITARYGKERIIMDVPEQTDKGILSKEQGAKNSVYFTVDVRTGLLLLEKDSERVAGREIIGKFIRFHKGCIEPYLNAFNKKFNPHKMHRPNFLKINSLPKQSFFEEIKEFSEIKEAYYYLDISERIPTSNEISNLLYLENKAKEEGVRGTTRVKVSFEAKGSKKTIRGIEQYFQKLFDSQYFDGLGVSGKLDSGRYKNIELENIQRAFDINVGYNENGLPSLQDMYDGMVTIISKENPLEHKKSIVQYEGVEIGEEEDREV